MEGESWHKFPPGQVVSSTHAAEQQLLILLNPLSSSQPSNGLVLFNLPFPVINKFPLGFI